MRCRDYPGSSKRTQCDLRVLIRGRLKGESHRGTGDRGSRSERDKERDVKMSLKMQEKPRNKTHGWPTDTGEDR